MVDILTYELELVFFNQPITGGHNLVVLKLVLNISYHSFIVSIVCFAS